MTREEEEEDNLLIDKILELLKGWDLNCAERILEECKVLIKSYSIISYPWDRIKQESNNEMS